jgi:predicted nucleotidyltransferase
MPEQTDLTQLIESLRQQLPLLEERYRVESLGVFGSYVRHEQRPDSDLDVLVTFREAPSLLKFIELENYLSGVLGVKIDLVMKDALKPHIGQRILNEAVAV